MSNDSAAAARAMKTAPGDTLLVWGYRPDLFALTGLRTGTPFLVDTTRSALIDKVCLRV